MARYTSGQLAILPNGYGNTSKVWSRVSPKKYGVDRLVYCEVFARPQEAIQREKRLKKWNRAWKVQLIESTNPEWKDLYETVMDMP